LEEGGRVNVNPYFLIGGLWTFLGQRREANNPRESREITPKRGEEKGPYPLMPGLLRGTEPLEEPSFCRARGGKRCKSASKRKKEEGGMSLRTLTPRPEIKKITSFTPRKEKGGWEGGVFFYIPDSLLI